jgi:hypothetical protein
MHPSSTKRDLEFTFGEHWNVDWEVKDGIGRHQPHRGNYQASW